MGQSLSVNAVNIFHITVHPFTLNVQNNMLISTSSFTSFELGTSFLSPDQIHSKPSFTTLPFHFWYDDLALSLQRILLHLPALLLSSCQPLWFLKVNVSLQDIKCKRYKCTFFSSCLPFFLAKTKYYRIMYWNRKSWLFCMLKHHT